MHLRGLDLNLLVALDALLEERNVTRAAERVNISQSGMSAALARLREYFDDQLLVPLGRKMVLTPLAQTFLAPVREIVLRAHTLIDATPGFNPVTAQRRFTIMASDYVARVLLAGVSERLVREAPSIVLEIVPHVDVPSEPLERGDIDLLIMPQQYLSQDHPSLRLFSDRYVCVSWVGNDQAVNPPDFDQYLALGHVVPRLGKGRNRGMAFDEWFLERFERHRRVDAIVMSFTMLSYFVVGTQRLATMHARLAEQDITHLPLRIHPLPFDMPEVIETLQWNGLNDPHPALAWLKGVLLEVAAELEGRAPGSPG